MGLEVELEMLWVERLSKAVGSAGLEFMRTVGSWKYEFTSYWTVGDGWSQRHGWDRAEEGGCLSVSSGALPKVAAPRVSLQLPTLLPLYMVPTIPRLFSPLCAFGSNASRCGLRDCEAIETLGTLGLKAEEEEPEKELKRSALGINQKIHYNVGLFSDLGLTKVMEASLVV